MSVERGEMMPDQRGAENQNLQSRQEQPDQRFNSVNDQTPERQDDQDRLENSESRNANRGFAAMSPERQRQIASEGGRAAHRQGVAHEWNTEEARKAGRKGGEIVSRNREHMSEIGRKGGQSSGGRRKNQQNENPE